MKVGDLVKWNFKTRYADWKEIGIIIRCIPGTVFVDVHWSNGERGNYKPHQLKVVRK